MFSIVAENICDLLEFNCTNHDKGCDIKLIKPEILQHQKVCVYTENLDCPNYDYGCNTKVSVHNCIAHISNSCKDKTDSDPPVLLGKKLVVQFESSSDRDGLWSHSAVHCRIKGKF